MAEKILRAICDRFRGRVRKLLLEYGILQGAFLCLLVIGVLVFSDWYFRFSTDMRLLSLVFFWGAVGLCYYFGFHRPLQRSWRDDEVLGYMDRTSEDREDALVTFRDLSHPEGMREYDTEQGKEMVHAVVADLAKKVEQVDISRGLRQQPLRRWRRMAGLVIAVFVVGLIMPRDRQSGQSYLGIGMKRLFLPYASIYWPQKTRLFVQEPESGWRVPKGESFHVKVKIDGEVPPIVEITYKTDSSQMPISERMAVNPAAAEASFVFPEMTEAMTFYCTGGDDRDKRKYSVSVAERPMLTAIQATYVFPPYAQLPKKTTHTGQLSGLEGADVTLDFTASTDLAKVTLRFNFEGEEGTVTNEIAKLHGKKFSHNLRLTKSGAYIVDLLDTKNLKNGRVERYEIRVEPDNPPEVTLEEPARDAILTAKGKVPVKFKAKDDFNLVELQVLLGPVGKDGKPIDNKITGDFWSTASTLHKVGDAGFDLDFLKQRDSEMFKAWNLDNGAELELWVRAVDCNPSGKGITESGRVRLSVLRETDFMEAVLMKAKELMIDARVGWYAAAGAYHDGVKWVQKPVEDKSLDAVLEQQQGLERAAAALNVHYPAVIQDMQNNRMFHAFMGKRLESIGTKISEMNTLAPNIGKKIAAGRPGSAEENQPAARLAKMTKAVQGVLPDQNKAAWYMRLLYDRIADWVALQSVLLKTRRIEELQRDVNVATDKLVKKTLGKEARELEDEQIRETKEVASQQQTVHDMEEAVEKELGELILQADKDGRKKVWESLGKAWSDLRENRIKDKLQRAAMAIMDARANVVRDDQKLVLEIMAVVNRGLIRAGEDIPPDPPASMFAAAIEDPRTKPVDEEQKLVEKGGDIDADDYKNLEKLRMLGAVKVGTLDESLDGVFRRQDDIRNRTAHVAKRGNVSPRYLSLRTGLTAQREGVVVDLLKTAITRAQDYGKTNAPSAGGAPAAPDPAIGRARERLVRQAQDYLGGAEDCVRLLQKSHFGSLTTDIQKHIYEGSRDLRVYIQETERLHQTSLDRKASGYKDAFERQYLVRENNLDVMVDVAKDLEWALVLQTAAQRETDLLGRIPAGEKLSAEGKAATDRVVKVARQKSEEVAGLVAKAQEIVSTKITDPTEPDRENEKVKPQLQEKVLTALDAKPFQEALAMFDRKEYAQLAAKQEGLRRSMAGVPVSLKDLFDARVPPKAADDSWKVADTGNVEADSAGFIEYRDETPDVLAKALEEDGAWIDARTGDPEVRKTLVKHLKGMEKFDPRYARLQSAYFQAVAQDFQARAKKDQDKKKADEKKKDKK